ncbi:MAG: hypothetical protein FWB78_06110, partial [Treponema sp.]|nr:hypothetical protein [Treponema sp.]
MQKADFHEWIGAGERLADLTVSSEEATRRKATAILNLPQPSKCHSSFPLTYRRNSSQREKYLR